MKLLEQKAEPWEVSCSIQRNAFPKILEKLRVYIQHLLWITVMFKLFTENTTEIIEIWGAAVGLQLHSLLVWFTN